MTPSEAIFAKLNATAGVTDLVSNRIYPVEADQGVAAPYVVFQQIGADPDETQNEAAGAVGRLFQFACFASTYEGAVALRNAVTAALDNVKLGNNETPTLTDERDADFDDAAKLYRSDCDLFL